MAKRKTAGRNRPKDSPEKGKESAGGNPRKRPRWHPSQESDELVFAVCDFFLGLGDGNEKRAVVAVVDWVQENFGRTDITRERVYPIFREGIHRRFVTLRPPLEDTVAQRIADLYALCDASSRSIRTTSPASCCSNGAGWATCSTSPTRRAGRSFSGKGSEAWSCSSCRTWSGWRSRAKSTSCWWAARAAPAEK